MTPRSAIFMDSNEQVTMIGYVNNSSKLNMIKIILLKYLHRFACDLYGFLLISEFVI